MKELTCPPTVPFRIPESCPPVCAVVVNHAYTVLAEALVKYGPLCASLVWIHKCEPATTTRGDLHCSMMPVDFPAICPRSDPEAETFVDQALRRGQGREGFASLMDLVHLGAHHLCKNSASPMRCQNRDVINKSQLGDPSGHGKRRRSGGRSADYLIAVKCAKCAIELCDGVGKTDVFLGRVGSETKSFSGRPVVELVLCDCPYLNVQSTDQLPTRPRAGGWIQLWG